MNANARLVARSHAKINDCCDLAAARTVLIGLLIAVPVAVGTASCSILIHASGFERPDEVDPAVDHSNKLVPCPQGSIHPF